MFGCVGVHRRSSMMVARCHTRWLHLRPSPLSVPAGALEEPHTRGKDDREDEEHTGLVVSGRDRVSITSWVIKGLVLNPLEFLIPTLTSLLNLSQGP